MVKKYVLTAMAIALASGQQVGAQNSPGAATFPGSAQATAQPQAGSKANLDQAIAGCLLLVNHEQVALAKFGEERAKSQEVKKFAQMLASDHEMACTELQTMAPEQAAAAKMLGQQSNGQSMTAAQASPKMSGDNSQQIFDMQRRATQECLTLTKQMLGEEQGADFDMAFVGSQVGAHVAMLAKLRAAEPYASAELKPVLSEAKSQVEEHLKGAKALCKKLKQDSTKNRAASNKDASRR